MKKQEQLNESPKYQAWHSHLVDNQLRINDIQPLHIQRTHKDGSVLYTLLNVDADTPEGTKLNPICFLKGDAVSMLVVLIDEQTNAKYVLLVKQRRVCDGSESFEHPAGMIDKNESPADVAARELGEEAQLTVAPGELKPLFDKPLFSGTSTSDEALYFFYLERRLPLADILSLNGRKTGAEGENEHTELRVVSMPEAHRLIRNMHGIMSHLLYLNEVGDYETMRQL